MATTAAPYGLKPVRMIGNRYVGGALPTNQYRISQNYSGVIANGSPVVLTGTTTYTSGNACTVTYSGQTVTLTFATAVTTLYAGMPITLSGITGATAVNGTWILVTGAAGTVFTFAVPATTTITGTVAGTAAVLGGAGFLALPTNGSFNSLSDKYVGIFVGAQYTNAQNGQPQWDQYYPGSVNSAGMIGYVVDDPDAVFQIQANAINFDALGAVGTSFGLNIPATPYSLLTKDSTISLANGTATSSTSPYKVVDIAQAPDNVNAVGYVDVYVVAQQAAHHFRKAL